MVPSFTASAVFLLVSCSTATSELNPLSDEYIALLNTKQKSWKAGRNFAEDTPMAYLKGLMGLIVNDHHPELPVKTHDADLIASLPDNFDPREKWSQCSSLNEIRDQGACGSCWVFGAVEAITDRICIHSNGTKKITISAEDVVSCCDGSYFGQGCNGGLIETPWLYYRTNGIVSGGAYNSSEGCMPYLIPQCDPKDPETCKPHKTPECVPKCEPSYNVEYSKDKNYGKMPYMIQGEDDVKAELFKHGPVEVGFIVYDDFLNYKSGVYHHVSEKVLGLHAVKMMGWGVEDNTKYWLLANSWGPNFGEKGFFKILRGSNECFIEVWPGVAGEPILD